MTKKEAAIVSAYTGILIGEIAEMHKYIEQIMGGPVWTHELADRNMWDKIKEKSRHDFMSITVQE